MTLFYGHQQNTGGNAYYYSGMRQYNRNNARAKEDDLNKPDAKTTETPDQNNPQAKVEKSAQPSQPVVMENIEVKKADPKDEQVEGVKMEITKY